MSYVNILDPEYIGRFRDRQHKATESVPTPFDTWNRNSGGDGGGKGLARGWFIVVGGNPKKGKTLLSLNMVKTGLLSAERVGFMSLEMADPELAARFYAMLSQKSVTTFERGDRFRDDSLDAAVEVLRGLPVDNGAPSLFVNSEPVFDLGSVLEYMRFLRVEENVKYFIIDYLQLVSMGDDYEEVRTCTVAVKEFRRFAKQSGSVVIALSQFKRSVSEDYAQSPMPQGLFGGGAIEQTADQIVLLDHSLYDYEAGEKVARTWLKLTNRHGQHGDIPIAWNYKDLTVREGLDDELAFWPNRDRRRTR